MIQKNFQWYELQLARDDSGNLCQRTSAMQMPNGVLVRCWERTWVRGAVHSDRATMVFVPDCEIHEDADDVVCLIGPEVNAPRHGREDS